MVISDGGDNHSRYRESELRQRAIESDVQIYAISIVESNRSDEEKHGAFLLQELSELTGGCSLHGSQPHAASRSCGQAGTRHEGTLRDRVQAAGWHAGEMAEGASAGQHPGRQIAACRVAHGIYTPE